MSKNLREIERKVLRLLHGRNTRTQLTQIHAHFLRHGLHQSNQILAHFVSICAALDRMPYATRVFSQSQNPNVLLFNSMIKGYSLCPPFQQSFHFFSIMKSRGILPDDYTFAPLLKSTSNISHYQLGQSVHAQIIGAGFERHGSIRIGLVELYAACERMADADKVFDTMCDKDVIVWNLMIRGFCKAGYLESGLTLFRQMNERSIVSWNIIISCLAQSKKDDKALELFREMLEQGFEPDDATLVTVLPVCARLGALDAGKWIHSYANSRGFQHDVIAVGNSLIDFYCKSGNLEAAWSIFNEMPHKNVVSWNAMISGLAYNGKGELGVDLFLEMVGKGVNPSDSTFVGVLACCAHAGLVDRGLEMFALMTAKFQLEPKLEHYGCFIDLLGRCGQVREAHDLIRSMPMKPTAAIWGSLLSACRTYGERELAKTAIKELISLEPWNSGNYVLLSNIYAEEGQWDEVEKVRDLMRENDIKKTPGQSAAG
ncbi:pentatricopeptide repeat-containing protein [Senna tora]|uniref:Pentatricopeptide repeat-containing protein n=1 Tax=Senna tora TaxID=362788 RepID=A0A834W0T8_9FABA|nr:pentatricopeptide repeat-containing protein [Senna tora]